MTTIRFQLKNPRKMGVLYATLGSKAVPELARALATTGRQCVTRLREQTRAENIRDLGKYERGWKWDRLAAFLTIRIRNAAEHAIFVEMGRRAGARQPPFKALEPWVRRHIKVIIKASKRSKKTTAQRRAAAIRAITFLICRAIGRRGIKARPVLYTKWMQDVLRLRLRFNVTLALDRAVVLAADKAKGY